MGVPEAEKEAARAVLRELNPQSILENVEYGAALFLHRHQYVASAPITSRMADGLREDDVLTATRSGPKGARLVAFCHTHGKDMLGTFSELFSGEDKEMARHLKINAYLATPGGELLILRSR